MWRVLPVAGSSQPSSPDPCAVYQTPPSRAGATSCGRLPAGTRVLANGERGRRAPSRPPRRPRRPRRPRHDRHEHPPAHSPTVCAPRQIEGHGSSGAVARPRSLLCASQLEGQRRLPAVGVHPVRRSRRLPAGRGQPPGSERGLFAGRVWSGINARARLALRHAESLVKGAPSTLSAGRRFESSRAHRAGRYGRSSVMPSRAATGGSPGVSAQSSRARSTSPSTASSERSGS